jgi:hypothetical protein
MVGESRISTAAALMQVAIDATELERNIGDAVTPEQIETMMRITMQLREQARFWTKLLEISGVNMEDAEGKLRSLIAARDGETPTEWLRRKAKES